MAQSLLLLLCILQVIVCSGQVPVSKEPRHHNVFENDYVRVLDVHLPAGDTSLFHKHETPSVFVMIRNMRTGSEVISEEAPATALAKDPSISFEGFYAKPRIHRVWNSDTAEFHVMDIELLKQKDYQSISPIEENGFQLLFDEKPLCAYRLTLNAETTISVQRKTPLLVIGLTNALNQVMVNNKPFKKKSDFLFVPAGKATNFTNKESQPYSFVVLELK
jgi:glyoxylate utilization-related uncharacterized protein